MNSFSAASVSSLGLSKLLRAFALGISSLAALLNVTPVHNVFAAQPASAFSLADTGKTEANDDEDDDDDDDGGGDAKPKSLQPVRVGDLIGRDVIAPVESQVLLGHVTKVVSHGGDNTIVMTYGGTFGFGGHSICVPAAALALTGYNLQAKGIETSELDKLPACDGAGDSTLAANASINMKLAKPSH